MKPLKVNHAIHNIWKGMVLKAIFSEYFDININVIKKEIPSYQNSVIVPIACLYEPIQYTMTTDSYSQLTETNSDIGNNWS